MTHYDLVIVGGGSAGALLANRLSADAGRRVLLIEAGGEPDDPDIWTPAMWPAIQHRSYDWDHATTPQPGTAGRVHSWARGKALGGSSLLHAMGHFRGHPDDYAVWAEATGDDRWRWDSLLPIFEALEQPVVDGDSGDGGDESHTGMPVWLPEDEVSPLARAYMDAGAALGLPRLPGHNTGRMIGVSQNTLMIRGGRRVTTADAWLTAAVRARPNLTLLTGTLVHHLEIEGARVTALATSAGRIEADRVVLAAGALATPALLMRSGIGPEPVLADAGVACRHAVPEIGRNLMDHLLGAGNLYAAKRPVPPSRLQHSESMTYLRAGDFTAGGQPEIVVGCGVAPIVSECFEAPAAGTAYSLLFGVTHPTSRGEVRITGPDPDDPLVIDPRYLSTDNDRRLFRAALAAAREIGHRPELADWRDREILPGPLTDEAAIDGFIAKAAITHHHPSGTCRMGKDAAAPVDGAVRLKCLDGVHVVDASVLPRLTAGPIHAAVLAVAERFCRGV